MNTEEVKKLIVNVKGVDLDAWEMARKLAARHDESLGSVVSRSVRQLYNADTGPRESVPNGSANLSHEIANLTEDQRTARIQAVASMMQGLAAIKTATGRASGRDVVMQEVWALDRRTPRRQTPGQAVLRYHPSPELPTETVDGTAA